MKGVCRVWNISLIAVFTLSIYNIFLTVKLLYNAECIQKVVPIESSIVKLLPKIEVPDLELDSNDNLVIKLDLKLGRWDNRLHYQLYDNVFVGEHYTTLSEIYLTCLATQSSLDRLGSIIQVTNHWNGPISLAAFAAGDEEFNNLILYVSFLRQCYNRIRDQVTFHFAFPHTHKPREIKVDGRRLAEMDCENPIGVLQQLIKPRKFKNRWKSAIPYPQNHMRNLARKNCHSKFVFLTDIDIVPSPGMVETLDIFLAKSSCRGLCAFVIPTYELDDRVRFPPNKSELIRLADKGLARPFHHKVFIFNQFATNFTRWQSVATDGPEVHISHPVTNFEFLYEPFYVATDTVPPHDERFVGYGYTRNSQVYEMYVAGYEFMVLSPIFTCHWGMQVKRSRPPWREPQNNANRNLFEGFKREVFAKYKKDPLNMMVAKKT